MSDRFSVLIQDCGVHFSCDGGENLLRSMEALGRRGIPVGCRGGGCGVCKVWVVEGHFHTRKMSRACLSEQEEADGVVLACRLFAESDLSLQVVGKMVKALRTAES
jgi:ferredoxin